LTVQPGFKRSDVVNHLEENGVQTRMLFAGNILRHPCFDAMRKSKSGFRVVGKLKNTDRIVNDTFWIGVYPGLTEEMIAYMARLLA
jgi:CDP-6-deoxy-D-xylo-4-hexulose-3-dehydrase